MVLSSLHTSLRAFDFGSGGPLACFSHVFTNMFDRRCADMFGHVCLFGSGGPLACLVMFKQTCWELWSLLHMAHWHVYILFDRLTCTMTCQVKQMIGIVSWAKVPWQKLQTKVVSTSCFEMSWWGSLEAKYFFSYSPCYLSLLTPSCSLVWPRSKLRAERERYTNIYIYTKNTQLRML